ARPVLGVLVFLCLMARRELDGMVWAYFADQPYLPWVLRGIKILTYCGYGFVAAAAYGLWKRKGVTRTFFPFVAIIGVVLFAFKIQATQITVETGRWPFGYVPGYWADFLMPVVLFFGAMAMAKSAWPMAISNVAKYAFGIYLTHPIFLDMAEILTRNLPLSPIEQVGVKLLYTLPLTIVLVLGLSQLRCLAWTIGLSPRSVANTMVRSNA
ncbi:MAG: hypothetical protein ACPG5U_08970, partial [Planktomarina sp.]